ncbi:ABC transporter ATP-binding protein [Bradyrhizobium sp. NP1]|uniref:ABC transporter ATP-binding protein n=1 Tax=Bradyrhizobium sp. NP1 TaxID=3049772 RepID=UPI0025A67533|nr:ABC transporter ATP-binding protein [Bradyrhizobium sp. NP1]WJR76871.1 ABC transporter ATP-binding protein [Bradyrhizobium sp. NP1]
MTEAILQIRGLCKSFGGLVVSDNISLALMPGEIHALIGPNGAGKSTLINQISGEVRPDKGTVTLRGRSIENMPTYERVRAGLARSFQVSSVLNDFTVLENARLAAIGSKLPTLHWWRPATADASATEQAMCALEKVRLAQRASAKASTLSYGERRQLELAMALALEPSVVLLDEPMAGVGPDEGRRLTELLDTLRDECAILLVEHDMDAIFALADRISVLVEGQLIATAHPNDIRASKSVQQAYLGTGNDW